MTSIAEKNNTIVLNSHLFHVFQELPNMQSFSIIFVYIYYVHIGFMNQISITL